MINQENEKEEEQRLPRLFVGGGGAYYGLTAARDKRVVQFAARAIFNLYGNLIEIVTGGMPGIPEDFANAWKFAGGKHVLCVVSSSFEAEYLARNLPFKHIVIGESQLKRRLAVTRLERIFCALFIQGGMYSTHEMQLFEQNKVPVVPFVGSGGASAGEQPYEGYAFVAKDIPQDSIVRLTDPLLDPREFGYALASLVFSHFQG